ncbi:MAG: PAS domain S-box protein [Sideroxydans sp.]|nr:PAS domain S-box protein [Sideroxydans sp.]
MQKLTLHSILSPSVFTVAPETALPDVLESMESLRISCVVAVDTEYHPVGIFTEQDAIVLMAERRVIAELSMSDVMSTPPLTAPSDMDFRDAYQLIAGKAYRHLIVVDEAGCLSGIVSEADFIHYMGMEYLVELKTVGSAMTRNLIILKEDATLADAVDMMAQHKISCVIVARDQKPIGILTERDTISLARTVNDPTHVHITQVMHSPVQTVDAQLPLQQAMQRMERSHIRRLVVVEGEILQGIVTRHDIVKNIQGRYIEFLHETLERQRKELHHAQQQIAETRQQMFYQSLMEQTNDAIFVVKPESGAVIECNAQACKSLGYTLDELLRLRVVDIDANFSTTTDWQSEHDITVRDGKRLIETQHKRRDGSTFPVEISAGIIEKNNEQYIVAVARDLTERKQVEAHLHLKDTALNSTANAIVITDKHGFIEWANPAFTEMTGYSLAEALGKRSKELVKSGLQTSEHYEVLWNTILSGKVWRGEIVNKRKDGTLYTEEMTITPVCAADKGITHFIAVKQDISARKESEFKLAQSEATYRGIINSLTESVYVADMQGTILDVNQGATLMYGYTREEILQLPPWALLATEKNDFSIIQSKLGKVFSGEPQHMEFWGVRKNGEIFPKSVNGVRGDYFGRPVAIIVARDISEQKTLLASLKESELRYRSLVENSPFPVVIVDAEDSSVSFANRPAEQLFNIDASKIKGLNASNFYVDLSVRESIVARQKAGEIVVGEEVEMRTATGKHIWILLTSACGMFAGRRSHIATLTDITERKAVEDKLHEAAAVMQNTREGVMVTDANANLIAVNPAFTKMTGYTATEVIGKNPRMLSSGRQGKAFYKTLWNDINKHGFWQGELWNRRKNGEIYPQLVTISAIRNDKDKPIRYLGVFSDITQLKENQAKLEFMAHHDPLTKLSNRSLAESRLEQELEQARRHAQQLSVLFIDLDRFKQVNDSFGHIVGDELLCAVAKRLNERLREGDTLGRLGGDEFILIASPLQDKQDAAVIARDIINTLAAPFLLSNGVEVFIGGSIGISLYPDNGSTVAELTKNADAAMYLAKENGRNQFSFYTPELNADARNKLELENDLRRAVLHQELVLHYQPKVDIRTGMICGAEALTRWPKADGTWTPPSQFIPLAEKSGVILTIGNWVLEETCAQIKRWRDEGLPEICIAINVSSRQFRSGHLDKLVSAALNKFAVPARCLELELTESMLIHEPEAAIETMRKLKKIGVKISLDDFGTGYSNFGYLRRFPIDSLKIDQSFVQGISSRAEDAMIVDAIISLAQRMKLRVISEGVETLEQLSYLRTRGCDEIQGFYFSEALAQGEFSSLLRNGKTLNEFK